MAQKDKRRSFRLKESFKAQCSYRQEGSAEPWKQAQVLNLSEAGICLLAGQKLAAKRTVRLRVLLTGTGRPALSVRGTVITSQKTLSGMHLTGVAFVRVTERTLRLLRTYIAWILTKKEECDGLSRS